MKLFLAIDIPEEVKQSLSKQIDTFRLDYPYYSWNPPKNQVVMVNFLGEVEKQKFDAIKKRIEDILYDADPFSLYSLQSGVHIDKKIEVYLAFQRQKKLEEIEAKIAEDIGLKRNYKYAPELTLATWKIPSKQQYFHLKKKVDNLEVDIEFPVTYLTMYQSVSTSDTPTYVELGKIYLGS